MKHLPRWVLFAALALSLSHGLPAQTADADYAAFQTLGKAQPPASFKEMGAEKYYRWMDETRRQLTDQALAFHEKYPTDPRRWEVLMAAARVAPLFVERVDVNAEGVASVVPDAAAKAAWTAKMDGFRDAMLASADASPALREDAEWMLFARDFRATSAAKSKGEPYDYRPFKARFDAHAAKYAALDIVAGRATDYLGALERNLPGASTEIWQHLQESAPNEALRAKAAERLNFLELTSKPLEMAFTAVDGRPFDLKQLRGKVVLIDFWATWCGPCIAELPNVKKVYAAYHDKGFEIVGIALENGKLLPNDTPEQAAAKHVAAKKVLTDFTTKEEMPWPQYYDGKWWKNDISTKYAINGIPAMFLLDQDGKIVSTNARGEALEREVKRLLKL